MQKVNSNRGSIRRSVQLNVRLRTHEKELVEAAARIRRVSPSELVREATLEFARSVLTTA